MKEDVYPPAIRYMMRFYNDPQTRQAAFNETLPGRMLRDVYGAATLPGDVYTGKVPVYVGENVNPEVLDRAGMIPKRGGMKPAMAAPTAEEAEYEPQEYEPAPKPWMEERFGRGHITTTPPMPRERPVPMAPPELIRAILEGRGA